MLKYIISAFLTLIALTSFSQSETGVRVFSGKCAVSQTGSGSGYWIASITNFNDPGGLDASDIEVGDFLRVNDSGVEYALEITLITSASGSSATFRVSNVGITGISSIPTTTNAGISRRTTNFGLMPFFANMTDNDNQLQNEYTMYKIDSLLNVSDGAFFATLDTLVFSPAGKTPINGDFAIWKKQGQIVEQKADWWQPSTIPMGELVHPNDMVTVAYPALGLYTPQLASGTRHYISCNGDLTVQSPDFGGGSNSTKIGRTYVFDFYNATVDSISVTWETFVFKDFNLEGMPVVHIPPSSGKLFSFKMGRALGGELITLVSNDDIRGLTSASGWYTPTITKNVASDTIVTVYTHFYERTGSTCTIKGKVLLNNAIGTVSSSFRISFPPSITSDFINENNDVAGTVTSRRSTVPSVVYPATSFADISNDRVTAAYDTDNNTGTRQLVEYVLNFKIQ